MADAKNQKILKENAIDDCVSKDKQLQRLKWLMSQSAFHMLIDVQEMVEKSKKVKTSLGKDGEGFDDDNYSIMQELRLDNAQK